MISALYGKLCQVSPGFNKFTKRIMYQYMADYYQEDDWTFMNYGYAHLGDAAPQLEAEDEVNRFCIQLYHHVASAVNLAGAKVLEVGSGRGGGAIYLKHYLQPDLMVGVDFSKNAVKLCQKTYCVDGLTFVPGDAEQLPFDEGSFDTVINVESSHCYPRMAGFLSEVTRVLRPGGYFLFADFRNQDKLGILDTQLEQTGMRRVRQTNITPNVVAALDQDHARKLEQIQSHAPKFLVKLFQEFAGNQGSRIYGRFQEQITVYQSFVLQKGGV